MGHEQLHNQFSWDSSLSVNNPEIDSANQRTFKILNSLNLSIKTYEGKEEIRYLLEKLIVHIRMLFILEERLMSREHFPDLKLHECEHISMLDLLLDCHKGIRIGEKIDEQDIQFIFDWFIVHTIGAGKKFMCYTSKEQIDSLKQNDVYEKQLDESDTGSDKKSTGPDYYDVYQVQSRLNISRKIVIGIIVAISAGLTLIYLYIVE